MICLTINRHGFKDVLDSNNFVITPTEIYDADTGVEYSVDGLREIDVEFDYDGCASDCTFVDDAVAEKTEKHLQNCKECDYKIKIQRQESAMQDANKIVSVAIKIRDAIAAKKKEQMEELKGLQGQYEMCLGELQKMLDAQNVESLRTDSGTVSRVTKQFVGVKDYDAFITFTIKYALEKRYGENCTAEFLSIITEAMLSDGPLHFLNKSVGKNPVLEYMGDHGDIPPSGIEITQASDISLRRPTAK